MKDLVRKCRVRCIQEVQISCVQVSYGQGVPGVGEPWTRGLVSASELWTRYLCEVWMRVQVNEE